MAKKVMAKVLTAVKKNHIAVKMELLAKMVNLVKVVALVKMVLLAKANKLINTKVEKALLRQTWLGFFVL